MSRLILFKLFTTGVIDTSGKLTEIVADTSGKICCRVIDTGHEFAKGVVDTGSAPWLATIFNKIWNDPNVIFRDLGEDDSWNKPEAKNLVTLSL